MIKEDVSIPMIRFIVKDIDEHISSLIERLIKNGMGNPGEDNLLRGKILAYQSMKDFLLNIKAQGL